MSQQEFKIHHLANGLTLIGEEMPWVSSAAFSLLLPFGSAWDPEGGEGLSSLMAEMFTKGAGPWDSRQLSQQFEDVGIQRGHSVGSEASLFSAAMLPENLERAFELISTMLTEPHFLEPHFPEGNLENVKQLALHELKALEDEPSSKVMTELVRNFYPRPFGRSQLGTIEGVAAANVDAVKQHYQSSLVAKPAILGVAGNIDWDSVCKSAEKYFGKLQGEKSLLEVPSLSSESSVHHLQKDTAQMQIALAYPSISYEHPHYYTAKVTIGVLSGGMAGRLFIEVREKRGLVYRVSASHSAARNRAATFAVAGTTPENVEETLSVMMKELRNLKAGVTEEELSRAKADLKTRVIMQSEISSSRATALVNDWWNLKRVRNITEIREAIDSVSESDIVSYVTEFPVSPVTLQTLGPKAVELPS